jgi:urease accessory protein
MDADTESYTLLLLSDGNLPTGSFVASSGLEAYEKHGFFGLSSSQNGQATGSPPAKTDAIISFMRDSVQTYAHSSLPFILAVYDACDALQSHGNTDSALSDALESVIQLDNVYEATTLNHVTRRASTSQGVALLTLLLKGLVPPAWMGTSEPGKKRVEALADSLKLEIRLGTAHGHLPVCWGILTTALSLSPSESFNNSPALQTRLI